MKQTRSDIRTHGTLQSRRVLYQLSYLDDSAGMGSTHRTATQDLLIYLIGPNSTKQQCLIVASELVYTHVLLGLLW